MGKQVTTDEKNLNPRQWRLHDYLQENNHDFKHLRDIIQDLADLYKPSPKDELNFNNSRARRVLTADLTALKNSGVIQTVLISTVKGVKFATMNEYLHYLKAERIMLQKRLKLVVKQERKAKRHNQTRLVFGKERQTIKAFVDDESPSSN